MSRERLGMVYAAGRRGVLSRLPVNVPGLLRAQRACERGRGNAL